MENIIAAIHQELVLISELTGEEQEQMKQDYLGVLESALSIMKTSSNIISVQEQIQVLRVTYDLYFVFSFIHSIFSYYYWIFQDEVSSDLKDSHSLNLLLQQKTLQMDLLQIEVNGMKANLILTEYLVKVMERKHEILLLRRQVNLNI